MTENRVRTMRKFYLDHPTVKERAEPANLGKVVDVDDAGLLTVEWARGRKGTHTEDEIVSTKSDRGVNEKRGPQLRGMVDAFADVRGFLPGFADEPDAFDDRDD